MRAVSPAVAPLFACLACALVALSACQDSNSSNAERDTHMGNVQAAVASAAPLSAFGALPPVAPGAGTPMAIPIAAPPASDAGRAKDAPMRLPLAKP